MHIHDVGTLRLYYHINYLFNYNSSKVNALFDVEKIFNMISGRCATEVGKLIYYIYWC